ncbi:MAG TPA: hypothetical protein PLL80_00510 [Candidatus Pacearchaeota archaeon]|nr:hypothetical protein [Candidatus Pacearchaeota archaeon]HOK94012.1 hypothetical protein [Candidatus Pacearchaeota archaeon]HPO75083.1 hypothetical protein [Candidatus Pacearchaeota archaeon]
MTTNPQKKPHKTIIDTLRDKPEKTRKRILLGSAILLAIILIYFWILQLKTSIASLNFNEIPKPPETEAGTTKSDVEDLIKGLKDISDKNRKELEELNKNLEELQKLTPEEQKEIENNQ